MKEIKLSKTGKYRDKYVALVDDEDYEKVNQFNWYAVKDRSTIYAKRCIFVEDKRYEQPMQELILGVKRGDHIDHNGLNNQKIFEGKSSAHPALNDIVPIVLPYSVTLSKRLLPLLISLASVWIHICAILPIFQLPLNCPNEAKTNPTN